MGISRLRLWLTVLLTATTRLPEVSGVSAVGLARMDAPVGTIVAYATSPNSVAADGSGRNGVYTKNLLRALKKPDLDIQDVFNEAGMAVINETKRLQICVLCTAVAASCYPVKYKTKSNWM